MKRLLVIFMLISGAAAQSVSRYDNIAFGTLPGGNVLQALPNAMISVQGCASMSTTCALPANLCSGITDTSCGLPGVLYADSGGNFHFYARAGRYQVSITASGYQTRTINDVILPISASDGSGVGTGVTINGTAAVPNQLNFTNTLLPPSGSTVVNFLLNGNTVGAYVTGTGGGGGGGTPFTVNGVTPAGIVNFNASSPGPPPNGINVNWNLVGTGLTAAIVGDGNPNSCLIGTGIFAACPGGGGGGGSTLPTIPQYNLYASNGSGGAQDSAVKAGLPGFLETEVLLATGDVTSQAAPFQIYPNASVEYFPTGYAWSGGTVGAAHGFAGYFSHSSGTTASTNGGIGLGGANSSGTGNQVYLDCEIAGCDFKVPLTVNGGAVGGGGGGSGTVASGTAGHFTWYAATGTTVASNASLDDSVTTASTITSQETIAAPGINVNGTGGIAMTGVGGTLPTPVSGQGGIGIGPGSVPSFYSNGGAWTAIGSGTGGGVTNPIVFTGASLTAPASGSGGFGVMVGGMPAIAQNGGSYSAIKLPQVNAVALGPNVAAWNVNDTAPAATANGKNVSWQLAAGTGNISAQLVGDGTLNCLSGQGTYVSCGGAGGGTAVQVNGVAVGATANFNASTTVPPIPTNGKIIAFANSGTSVTAALVGDGSVNCLSGTGTYVACGAGGGGSGTVSPNSGTAGALAYYAAAGGSTTVAPVTATVATNGTGINVGTGVVQFGSSLTAADVNFTRPSPNMITIGSGTGQTGGYLNLNNSNSCSVTADTAFTSGNICQRTLPTGGAARPWIVHCVIPWNFTGGTGSANVVFGFNANAAPASASIFTTVLWGPGVSGGPVFGTALVPASAGQTPLITANALSLTDQTSIYAAFIDGVVNTTSGGVVYIYATTSNGTAQIRAGSYCTYE